MKNLLKNFGMALVASMTMISCDAPKNNTANPDSIKVDSSKTDITKVDSTKQDTAKQATTIVKKASAEVKKDTIKK